MSERLTIAEVCKVLGLRKSAVYGLLKSGQLHSVKVGPGERRYLVTGEDLAAYLAGASHKPFSYLRRVMERQDKTS